MTRTVRPPRRGAALLFAATLVATGAGPLVTPSTATAAPGRCPAGTGVTVVVDFGPLGGGVALGCDSDGAGKAASDVVPDAGFPLEYVSTEPGFVCSVSGKPNPSSSCGRTPPANAYWGIFWSDGSSTKWNYSTSGVGGLDVPEGGSIGWRFQNGGARDNPGAEPTQKAKPKAKPKPKQKPEPKTKPEPKPSPSSPGAGSGGPGGSGGSGAGQASTPTSTPTPSAPSATPTAQPGAGVARGQAEDPVQRERDADKPKATPDKGDAKKRDQKPDGRRKDQRDKRDKDSEESTDVDTGDEDEVATAEADFIDPVSTTDDGLGGDDVALLALAGLAAAGLGTYAVVASRRRRS